jgi:hypothetical protein
VATRPLRQIAILNSCTAAPASAVQDWVRAVQLQITRDVVPTWDAVATLHYLPKGSTVPAGYWLVAVVDDADQANALGYHDIGPHGEPMGKVFVRTTLNDGEEPSVTLSHEVLEMMGDPFVAQVVADESDPTKYWAREVCDACERQSYAITLPATATKPQRDVRVSDFVLPAYFNTLARGLPIPWTFLKSITGPVPMLAPGGYMAFVKDGVWSQVSRALQGNGPPDPQSALALHQRIDHERRRLLRLIPREQWRRTTATKVG